MYVYKVVNEPISLTTIHYVQNGVAVPFCHPLIWSTIVHITLNVNTIYSCNRTSFFQPARTHLLSYITSLSPVTHTPAVTYIYMYIISFYLYLSTVSCTPVVSTLLPLPPKHTNWTITLCYMYVINVYTSHLPLAFTW